MAPAAKRFNDIGQNRTGEMDWWQDVRKTGNWCGIDGGTLDTLYLPINVCPYGSGKLALGESVMSESNKRLLEWMGLDIPHR